MSRPLTSNTLSVIPDIVGDDSLVEYETRTVPFASGLGLRERTGAAGSEAASASAIAASMCPGCVSLHDVRDHEISVEYEIPWNGRHVDERRPNLWVWIGIAGDPFLPRVVVAFHARLYRRDTGGTKRVPLRVGEGRRLGKTGATPRSKGGHEGDVAEVLAEIGSPSVGIPYPHIGHRIPDLKLVRRRTSADESEGHKHNRERGRAAIQHVPPFHDHGECIREGRQLSQRGSLSAEG